ncbi:MAG: hypothetical protein LBB56_01805, partial [Chitinispirillales bacterium]|nr:hypothetical protein [Chitinispirillales bacterium]
GRIKLFAKAYNYFRNDFDISFSDDGLRKINESIKKYKLASSEGINKIGNRVIRLEILYKLCTDSNSGIKDQLKALEEKYSVQINTGKTLFDKFDTEDLIDISRIDIEE